MRYFTAFTLLSILMLFIAKSICAQTNASKERAWNAQWIGAPNDAGTEYGVYYFRKKINLNNKPSSFIIHISADNRYKLYVNGTLVSLGPTRSDTYYWNYETTDLSPCLKTGDNEIAAIVWNEAQYKPSAQVTIRTAFIIQGNSKLEEILNTNESWKCMNDKGHKPVPGYFFAASKGEMVNMNDAVKGDWTAEDFDDSGWAFATKISDGKLKGMSWGGDWNLVPSPLPPREMTYQRIPKLRYAIGVNVPSEFPSKKVSLTVPANTTAVLLLDQTVETNAYVTLNFSGGKDAGISLGYAEALYEKGTNGTRKGNRNDVDGKEFIGRVDSLISNGQNNQSFTTLNFRTYRYIRLVVHTKDEPLIIDDLYGTFTAYPFKRISTFNSTDTTIKQILDIGWRTARLNAWESYTDCPYYEQLQYIGDTRIQALVSYFNTNDDRLARNAISQIDHSRLAEGITRSCYPSNGAQIISTFSLWYICMLHDYWMYRGDDDFIKSKLIGERDILDFFSKYEQPDGSIKNMPYWAFVDWSGNFAGGSNGADGCAAIFDLQLLLSYQSAAQMEKEIGLKDYAKMYTAKALQLKKTINKKYWVAGKNLYADNIDKNSFSQHVNSLAILAGLADSAERKGICQKMLSDKSLTQCSIYFKYYLHQALIKGGLGNDYMNWLDIWRDNIKMGLTTWAEYSDLATTRSDCHAWGSSPNIEFYRTVLGVDSDAPGFKKIKIEPHLGSLTSVSGEIPHPKGKISVKYQLQNGKWKINISLPENTSGKLVWKAKEYLLHAESNTYML
ncbi:MAG: alpha-L-rhamnosidase C-terminal domain-containing protein [Arachidicoccus sp.]|nr:alpha-L-rhamnosidase C-terminal domain-containing protein [Arachidicoccus sp.]